MKQLPTFISSTFHKLVSNNHFINCSAWPITSFSSPWHNLKTDSLCSGTFMLFCVILLKLSAHITLLISLITMKLYFALEHRFFPAMVFLIRWWWWWWWWWLRQWRSVEHDCCDIVGDLYLQLFHISISVLTTEVNCRGSQIICQGW